MSSAGKILHCQHIKKGPDIQVAWELYKTVFLWMLNFFEKGNQKPLVFVRGFKFIYKELF